VRTGGAYNSGAHNDYVIGCVGHGFSFARRYFELVYTSLLRRARAVADKRGNGFHHRGRRGP
jgi:predicted alternative tryptophan synthase beta-subunit